jgi:hypothetical protein
MGELLPCPFCGEPAEAITGERLFTVRCVDGCAEMCSSIDDFPYEEYAINAWNARPSPVSCGHCEEMERLADKLASWEDMIESCAGVVNTPDSLPQMLLVEISTLRAELRARAARTGKDG